MYTNRSVLALLSTLLGVALEPWSDMQYTDILRDNIIGTPIEKLSQLKCFVTCKETYGCKGTTFLTKAHSDGVIGRCYLLKKAKDGRRRDVYGKQEFTSLSMGKVIAYIIIPIPIHIPIPIPHTLTQRQTQTQTRTHRRRPARADADSHPQTQTLTHRRRLTRAYAN